MKGIKNDIIIKLKSDRITARESAGRVIEDGTCDEPTEKKGSFAEPVSRRQIGTAKDGTIK